jgi:Sulfotransferase domain
MSSLDSFSSWPNFIVIGPGKCGTSWLFKVLESHSQVAISSAKETLFFESEFERGLAWYQKFFRHAENAHPRPLAIGEISNTYIFSPEAARRIAETFPQVRLLSTIRDPIDRAFSHFLFERRNGSVGDDFEEALQSRPDFISRGLYYRHLQPYFERFDSDHLKVFIYDDMVADIETYATNLFNYLGVNPNGGDHEIVHQRVLGASQARNQWVARCAVAAGRGVRSLGFPELVTKLKGSWLSKALFRPLDRNNKPTLDPQMRLRLQEYFRDDLTRLSEKLNRDLVSMWLKDAKPEATA